MEYKFKEENYVATLIGCALGDTLGMSVECWDRKRIQDCIGKITEPIDSHSYLTRDLKKGEYTDDTILTLAIAESIAEKKCLNFQDIMARQIKAYEKCKLPDGRTRGGFGGSTIKAFEKIIKGVSSLDSASKPGLGNGSPMKISPIGLYMHSTQKYEEGINTARQIGQSTHFDDRAVASGIIQAHAIYALLDNISRKEFLESIINKSNRNENKNANYAALSKRGTLTSKLKWVCENKDAEDEEAYHYLGNSCLAFESYPFTIFMFQKYWNKPIEGLIETVNWGGDCDTTGAMYGALCGAKNGMIFPEKWLNCLQNREKLEQTAKRIFEIHEGKNGK